MPLSDDRVVIAELLRSRGNRGEVLAISTTDVPNRFQTMKTATARLADGSDVPVELESAWRHGEHWVLKFTGVNSIGDAERFRGGELWVPRAERGKLLDGDYFRSDLLGCRVEDTTTGEVVGAVVGFEQYGGPLLLEVEARGREVLVPFVPEICTEVDIEARKIKVSLPEGLLDL